MGFFSLLASLAGVAPKLGDAIVSTQYCGFYLRSKA